MSKRYLTLYSDSNEEIAKDVSQAITKMWPCETNVKAGGENNWFEVYTFTPEKLSTKQKKLIPTWAGGYRYAKYGE